MRLIEAGSLKAEIFKAGGAVLATKTVLKIIDGMPEAEMGRGRWVDGDYGWPACSECGEYAGEEFILSRPYRSMYCPACGARMDDDKEKIDV